MTFSTTLKLLPLVGLIACESKPAATIAQPAAMPAVAVPPPKKTTHNSVQTFSWQDDTCTNTGTYTAGAYTQQQLRDTYQLVNGFLIMTTVVPFSLKNYNDAFFRSTASQLTHEHDSLAGIIHKLHVVPTKFWRNIKHLRELELAEGYALDQATLEGYFQPASWLSNRYHAACPEYATALASTDTVVVMKAWRKLVDQQKINNGMPKQLEAEFVAQSASPERMAYAKVALMTFGWGNCANAQRKYNTIADQYPLNEQFSKLFTKVKQSDCIDVD
ncbi:hypothetical protein A0257_02100 [Hymenobacter psoromatis]|nr:hypothetical protein A0257_02100 [Hymenobacter psoromatis]